MGGTEGEWEERKGRRWDRMIKKVRKGEGIGGTKAETNEREKGKGEGKHGKKKGGERGKGGKESRRTGKEGMKVASS